MLKSTFVDFFSNDAGSPEGVCGWNEEKISKNVEVITTYVIAPFFNFRAAL